MTVYASLLIRRIKIDLIKVQKTIKDYRSYLGVDAGGTFTDFVLYQAEGWRIHKVLSTPADPSQAILTGIDELGLTPDLATGNLVIIHGSTVATNAALERKGARTLYITNQGFADLLTIGRQARRELYNLFPQSVVPPVPKELCVEVDCRRDASGTLVKALSAESLEAVVERVRELKPEAIAVNLLYSFLNDQEERQLKNALKDIAFVSLSSEVLPVYKEYERGMATWLNASLGPKVNEYLSRLRIGVKQAPIAIMQSSGGTMSVEQASERAVNLLLSGPAGGLAAVKQLGQQCHYDAMISFDMGGTSTDVALMDGEFTITNEATINHWPVAIPMLEMETIGAGGGSLAWLDDGGMLHVGPESAGSDPGPACYGKGGQAVTVTDANLFLGRLQAQGFLGGQMVLDIEASRSAMLALANRAELAPEKLAEGIVQLAEQEMVRALHAISVKKGYDPSQFVLCCFGGAGGMHVCSLAEQMNIARAMVPVNSGVLSALGMLCAPKKRYFTHTYTHSWGSLSASELDRKIATLVAQGIREIQAESGSDDEIQQSVTLDLRYQGQSYCLNVPFSRHADKTFVTAHAQRFGHSLDQTVELVNICVELTVTSMIHLSAEPAAETSDQPPTRVEVFGFEHAIPCYQRNALTLQDIVVGPAIICEHVSTTWVKPEWKCQKDALGNLILTKI